MELPVRAGEIIYCIPVSGLYLQPLLDLQPGKMGIPAEKGTKKIFDPEEVDAGLDHPHSSCLYPLHPPGI